MPSCIHKRGSLIHLSRHEQLKLYSGPHNASEWWMTVGACLCQVQPPIVPCMPRHGLYHTPTDLSIAAASSCCLSC